jgi:uncharacterized integral membrane protein
MQTESQVSRSERPQRRFLVRHLAAFVILIAAVVFIAENTRKVRLQAIGPEVTAPLWAVLAATLVAGMLILLLLQRRRRHNRE